MTSESKLATPLLYALFAASGFAALVYQVVWQRALLTVFGVNIESVTVVVAAFMLGLGTGSLAGGRLSARPGVDLLRWFGGIELGIGALGAVSLAVFRAVGESTAGVATPAVFAITFALVVLPTSMMGATLPLLVTHTVRGTGNVGHAVGRLYFVNTLGSAAAAFVTATMFMGALGQQRTVWVAAAINGVVGAIVLMKSRGRRST